MAVITINGQTLSDLGGHLRRRTLRVRRNRKAPPTAEFTVYGYQPSAPSEVTIEKDGKALSFNGSTSYVSIPYQGAIAPATVWTAEAWIKPDVVDVDQVVLDNLLISGGNLYGFSLRLTDEGLAIASVSSGTMSSTNAVGSTAAAAGEWMFLSATFDGARLRLYVNGALETSTLAFGDYTANPSAALQVGRRYTGGEEDFYFDGIIDEVRIWNLVRTASEIEADYYKATKLTGTESGLVGLWGFDEGGGSTAADSSTTGADGTVNGATWTDDARRERIFGGVILNVTPQPVGAGHDLAYDYTVSAADWKHLLQRHAVTYRFPAQAAGKSLRYAIALYNPELDTSLVQDGPELPVFGFSDYPLALGESLAKLTGYSFRIDPYQRVIFEPRGSAAAPEDLVDGSNNFKGLQIATEATQIRNSVEVRGGMAAATSTTTDYFSGDGVTGNFKLSYQPYSSERNPLLQDKFSPASDYHPNSQLWSETDAVNASPPSQSDSGKPPFASTDGYLLVDNFGAADGACHLVGGTGSWGGVGLLSKEGFARADNRYILITFYVTTLGDTLLGFFDGIGLAEADALYAIKLRSSGSIDYQEGASTAATGSNYAINTTYTIRITLKAAGGATYQIQGGAFGTWGGKSWTTLRDTASGTTPTLYAGLSNKSAVFYVKEIRIGDPVLQMSVTVGGTGQVVGLDNVDSAQVDCLVNAGAQLLRFFPDNIPAPGTRNIVVTYYRAVPIRVIAKDGEAIAALKALTGETGDKAGAREFTIIDPTIGSREEARNRAQAELDEFADPLKRATWQTHVSGYDVDQTILINVAETGVNQRFLIDEVEYAHHGGDDYDYRIRAGATLKGYDDYLAHLIKQGKQVAFDINSPLEWMVDGADVVEVTEQLVKLTTTPEIEGADVVEVTEVIDELGFGPTPPYKYGSAVYGRACYH